MVTLPRPPHHSEHRWTWGEEAAFVARLTPEQLDGYARSVERRALDFTGAPMSVAFREQLRRLVARELGRRAETLKTGQTE